MPTAQLLQDVPISGYINKILRAPETGRLLVASIPEITHLHKLGLEDLTLIYMRLGRDSVSSAQRIVLEYQATLIRTISSDPPFQANPAEYLISRIKSDGVDMYVQTCEKTDPMIIRLNAYHGALFLNFQLHSPKK